MKQKGQGLVEFAVVAPFLVTLGIAIIYLGAMFMDYTQYSNAARDAARDVALQMTIPEDTTNEAAANKAINSARIILANKINNPDSGIFSRYAVALTSLYSPEWKATFYNKNNEPMPMEDLTADKLTQNAQDVEITISLKLNDHARTGGLLADWGVLPDELKPIKYRMALEEAKVIFVEQKAS